MTKSSLTNLVFLVLCCSVGTFSFGLGSLILTTNAKDKRTMTMDGQIFLSGVTVLEPPYIYSESGPYRGYCVDVIEEISQHLGFNYSLRQSLDGQIGSIYLMNGVYGELAHQNADFAIGDISQNWMTDESQAASIGVVFTDPILTSTLSVLLSKTLLAELRQNKSSNCTHLKAQLHEQNQSKDGASVPKTSVDCNHSEVSLEDIFDSSQLTRLVIKESPVHEFYSTIDRFYLKDLNIVEKTSLFGYGFEKLKEDKFVLIDESKFTKFIADQDAHFDLIDVSGQQQQEQQQQHNVKIDEMVTETFNENKAAKFRNQIVIALSKRLIEKHLRIWKRNWLDEFNQAIDQLKKSGKLKELQDKHWKQNFLRSSPLTDSSMSPPSIGNTQLLFLIVTIAFFTL